MVGLLDHLTIYESMKSNEELSHTPLTSILNAVFCQKSMTPIGHTSNDLNTTGRRLGLRIIFLRTKVETLSVFTPYIAPQTTIGVTWDDHVNLHGVVGHTYSNSRFMASSMAVSTW